MIPIKEIKDRLYAKPSVKRPDYSYWLSDQPLRQRTAITGVYLDSCEYYFNIEWQNWSNVFAKPTTTTVKYGQMKWLDADWYAVVPADWTYMVVFSYYVWRSNVDVSDAIVFWYLTPIAWQSSCPYNKFYSYTSTIAENLKKWDKLLWFNNYYTVSWAEYYQWECRYTFVKIS